MEGTSEAKIKSSIGKRFTSSKEFETGVDRDARRLTVKHTSMIEKIKNVLPLGKKKTRRIPKNSNTQGSDEEDQDRS